VTLSIKNTAGALYKQQESSTSEPTGIVVVVIGLSVAHLATLQPLKYVLVPTVAIPPTQYSDMQLSIISVDAVFASQLRKKTINV